MANKKIRYSPLFSVITATGARPEAFEICKQLVVRQTLSREFFEWIIVDDGPDAVVLDGLPRDLKIVYIRPEKLWQLGENTLVRNLSLGISQARNDWFAFMEDDDWYHPDYLKRYFQLIQQNDVFCVGEARAKYYHLGNRQYRTMINNGHASLCQTAFHETFLPVFKELLKRDNPYVDIPFWAAVRKQGGAFLFPESTHSVGIKGLPGRPGIGTGHLFHPEWAVDVSGSMLCEWIGKEDLALYYQYWEAREWASIT